VGNEPLRPVDTGFYFFYSNFGEETSFTGSEQLSSPEEPGGDQAQHSSLRIRPGLPAGI
jgi:hypothetical protein